MIDQVPEAVHSMAAHDPGQSRFKHVIARWIEHVVRVRVNNPAQQCKIVWALVGWHGYTAS
jgi:hypothetical protein